MVELYLCGVVGTALFLASAYREVKVAVEVAAIANGSKISHWVPFLIICIFWPFLMLTMIILWVKGLI